MKKLEVEDSGGRSRRFWSDLITHVNNRTGLDGYLLQVSMRHCEPMRYYPATIFLIGLSLLFLALRERWIEA